MKRFNKPPEPIMQAPFITRVKLFFGIIMLLVLPQLVPEESVGGFSLSSPHLYNYSIHPSPENLKIETVASLNFEFANWIPEAIRSVTIRLSSYLPVICGLAIFREFIAVLVVTPLYQLIDFSIKPDFVGFLFRLKPF